ncbi:EAL domain-containing protein [Vibrio parahaemolyticus]|nr:EAL domain-containing protein [Vibrio parahaemolyticus]MDG3393037.1 EAL domain-containing protein [Vibrio parahaemolyticus]MDG3403472.1 EAL domain-containing protein [Vibrio parahaemolyticus]
MSVINNKISRINLSVYLFLLLAFFIIIFFRVFVGNLEQYSLYIDKFSENKLVEKRNALIEEAESISASIYSIINLIENELIESVKKNTAIIEFANEDSIEEDFIKEKVNKFNSTFKDNYVFIVNYKDKNIIESNIFNQLNDNLKDKYSNSFFENFPINGGVYRYKVPSKFGSNKVSYIKQIPNTELYLASGYVNEFLLERVHDEIFNLLENSSLDDNIEYRVYSTHNGIIYDQKVKQNRYLNSQSSLYFFYDYIYNNFLELDSSREFLYIDKTISEYGINISLSMDKNFKYELNDDFKYLFKEFLYEDIKTIVSSFSILLSLSFVIYYFLHRKISRILTKYSNKVLLEKKKLKDSNKKIDSIAKTDYLTGLPNRRSLEIDFRKTFCLNSFYLVFIDLDGFKYINDTLGHSFGDLFLKKISNNITEGIDIDDKLYRFGGDEFIVIFQGNVDILSKINNLSRSINKPVFIKNRRIETTASIGISQYPNDGDKLDLLLQYADLAMYESKKKGRSHYTEYNIGLLQKANIEFDLVNDLRKACRNNEFYTEYQPKFDIKNRQLVGLEALVRWRHPKKGNIPPDVFIETAESADLIDSVGFRVIDYAIKDYYENKLYFHNNVTLSINLSPNQINENLKHYLNKLIIKKTIDTSDIIFEVTENVFFVENENKIEIINDLVELGFRFSLDDFGKGYSTLSNLIKLPLYEVKLDKCFLDKVPNELKDNSLLNSIINLLYNLEYKIVIEGIESIAQHDHLIEINDCISVQGFLYGKPESMKSIVNKFLVKNNVLMEEV